VKNMQKRSRDTQQKILAAARVLFKDSGYANTSAEQIAAAAGVAKGTLFAHFGDMANLLAAIGLDALETLLEDTRLLVSEPTTGNLADRTATLYAPWLKFFMENPDFARLFINQSALTGGQWTDKFVQSCSALEGHVKQMLSQEAPRLEQDEIAVISSGIQAFFLQVLFYRLPNWIGDDKTAYATFRAYIERWLQRV